MKMKKMAFPLLAAFTLSLLAVATGWAAQQQSDNPQAPELYQQCREGLKRDPKNTEAKQLCDEGMKLHRQGKDEEAIKTIQEGLAKLKQ